MVKPRTRTAVARSIGVLAAVLALSATFAAAPAHADASARQIIDKYNQT
jgi:hypothetical protein